MCGIAGIAGIETAEKGRQAISGMIGAMSHRGPDDEGIWVEENVVLGHTRLSIIDLSSEGHQPMTDATGRWTIVFNGEIYNYKEIRDELPDARFRSNTDTEVILAGFIEWGEKILEKLNGMFALAIWDREKERLFIARDRLGIKPFYFYESKGTLVFASEIRAILASGLVPGMLNKEALPEYLAYQTVMSPNTLVKNVFCLQPGESGFWSTASRRLEKKRYWNTFREVDPVEADEKSVLKSVRTLLQESVERRLMSDVSLGAFLSGGIDSSAVVALMATTSTQPIDTFSVVFDEKEYDESQYSDMIAKKYRTRHHPIKVKPNKFLEELPAALSAMDHPSGDGVNSYVVSKVTRAQGVTVALSGLGGDEVFAGYPVFNAIPAIAAKKMVWKSPGWMRRGAGAFTGIYPGGRRGEQLRAILSVTNSQLSNIYPLFRRVFTDGEIRNICGNEIGNPSHSVSAFLEELESGRDLGVLSGISCAEIETYMQNVLLRDTDQMSMAHSLEVRVPFLDHELVKYVLGVKEAYRKPEIPKKLLVKAMGELLPHEVVHRKKMGFVFPWAHWLKHDLKDFCDQRIATLEKSRIFKEGKVQELWSRFLSGDNRILWNHIWILIVLEEWMRQNNIEVS